MIYHGKGRGRYTSFLESEAAGGQALCPELREIRGTVDIDHREIRTQVHVPLLKQLMEQAGMGSPDWRDQFISGFPTLGELCEPGAYPPTSDLSGIIATEELFKEASSRFVSGKRGLGPKPRNSGLKLYPRLLETGSTGLINTRPQESFGWAAS